MQFCTRSSLRLSADRSADLLGVPDSNYQMTAVSPKLTFNLHLHPMVAPADWTDSRLSLLYSRMTGLVRIPAGQTRFLCFLRSISCQPGKSRPRHVPKRLRQRSPSSGVRLVPALEQRLDGGLDRIPEQFRRCLRCIATEMGKLGQRGIDPEHQR